MGRSFPNFLPGTEVGLPNSLLNLTGRKRISLNHQSVSRNDHNPDKLVPWKWPLWARGSAAQTRRQADGRGPWLEGHTGMRTWRATFIFSSPHGNPKRGHPETCAALFTAELWNAPEGTVMRRLAHFLSNLHP